MCFNWLNKPESSVYVLTSSHIDIHENIECNSVLSFKKKIWIHFRFLDITDMKYLNLSKSQILTFQKVNWAVSLWGIKECTAQHLENPIKHENDFFVTNKKNKHKFRMDFYHIVMQRTSVLKTVNSTLQRHLNPKIISRFRWKISLRI